MKRLALVGSLLSILAGCSLKVQPLSPPTYWEDYQKLEPAYYIEWWMVVV
jgi:hypothetical protein